MNMTKAIQVRNLSKRYLISHEGQIGQSTLVETLSRKSKNFFKRLRHPLTKTDSSSFQEEFWALKDVSFDVEEGDRLGIIGKNGAGKSTLLKILSRIVAPSSGQVKISGRLSCLLEVGTGFHPELTGRENIFLNGAILGMSRNEIKKNFDEIVAFAEVEQFLDTPVKRFSSGMYMRLGFAIAAHLDADLLVIDEVLAVGDSQFQAKCFKKLNDLGSSGRTVLFVSHDIGSVLSLCNKGIYLQKGKIVEAGRIDQCVDSYMKSHRTDAMNWEGVVGDEHIRVYQVSLERDRDFFYQNEKPTLSIDYEILKPHPDLFLGIDIWNTRHQMLARSHTYDHQEGPSKFSVPGKYRLSFKMDASLFREGDYLIKLHCAILNRKTICDDDIVLKFPVYSQVKNTRFESGSGGIALGNQWEWQQLENK